MLVDFKAFKTWRKNSLVDEMGNRGRRGNKKKRRIMKGWRGGERGRGRGGEYEEDKKKYEIFKNYF